MVLNGERVPSTAVRAQYKVPQQSVGDWGGGSQVCVVCGVWCVVCGVCQWWLCAVRYHRRSQQEETGNEERKKLPVPGTSQFGLVWSRWSGLAGLVWSQHTHGAVPRPQQKRDERQKRLGPGSAVGSRTERRQKSECSRGQGEKCVRCVADASQQKQPLSHLTAHRYPYSVPWVAWLW